MHGVQPVAKGAADDESDERQRPPWDARLIEWMQRSARHEKDGVAERQAGRIAAGWVVGAGLGTATGVGIWPAFAGVGSVLVVRWVARWRQSRAHRRPTR